MSPQMLNLIVSIQADEVVATFCCSLAFIALYTLVAKWWRSPLGRNLVAFDASLSLTLLPSVVHHAFGVSSALSEPFAWFTLGAFAAVPCVIVWRAVILVRMQLGGLHEDDPTADRPQS